MLGRFCNRLRTIPDWSKCVLAVGSGVIPAAIILAAGAAAVRLNLTNSVPIGFYLISNDSKARLVEFCPPEPFGTLSRERGYRERSGFGCPDGAKPLLKPVAAKPGDLVNVSGSGIAVNGTLIPHTAALHTDSAAASFRHGRMAHILFAAAASGLHRRSIRTVSIAATLAQFNRRRFCITFDRCAYRNRPQIRLSGFICCRDRLRHKPLAGDACREHRCTGIRARATPAATCRRSWVRLLRRCDLGCDSSSEDILRCGSRAVRRRRPLAHRRGAAVRTLRTDLERIASIPLASSAHRRSHQPAAAARDYRRCVTANRRRTAFSRNGLARFVRDLNVDCRSLCSSGLHGMGDCRHRVLVQSRVPGESKAAFRLAGRQHALRRSRIERCFRRR